MQRDGRGSHQWLSAAAFLGLAALVYATLFATWRALPYIRPGADLVLDAKLTRLPAQIRFAPEDKARVLVFGDSRILAGLEPQVFDSAAGPGVKSYNLGLPDGPDFMPVLEDLLRKGVRPTTVLTEQTWTDEPRPPSLMDQLEDSAAVAGALLPFRRLVRDALTFAALSRGRLVWRYRQNRAEVDAMLAHRGWYFIRGQSHFLHDQLPDSFRLPTDDPSSRPQVRIGVTGWRYRRLMQLADRYGFQVLIIPHPYRQGAFALPAAAPPVRKLSARLSRLGPDYVLQPARNFADPLHLNPAGAEAYSRAMGLAFAGRGG
jgi:hypothetical protein